MADLSVDGAVGKGNRRLWRFGDAVRRRLPHVQYALDAPCWLIAVAVMTLLRYDMHVDRINPGGVLAVGVAAAILQGLVGLPFGLYRRRFHYGSFDEVRVLACVVGVTTVVLMVVVAIFGGTVVPRSVPVLAGFAALVMTSIVRYVARLFEEQLLRPDEHSSDAVLVYGAGRTGTQLVHSMLTTPSSPFRPVALLDDDPLRRRLQTHGLRVVGGAADALTMARRYGVTSLVVADPELDGERLDELSAPLLAAGLDVYVLPPVTDQLGVVNASDVRPLTLVDLLGRRPVELDVSTIAGYIAGRRVLVTGAGGSIGSELCRQLHPFRPQRLIMLDRDESGLHDTQVSIEGRPLLDSPDLVLADIRDRDRVFDVFQQHRPEVVFHAAALKHLTLLELNPAEGWKTNVVGTAHVLEAAQAVGVQRFVNISTDKAADPANVLGYVKRICERMTAAAAAATGLPFVSVRFGNVLGSKGSMLGVFQAQVAAGGPVTVTHPDVTRYFMMTEEAVALTMQAGAFGTGGEVLILDMGDPVRIRDVAARMIADAGKPVEIVYTGLRPGEKLHEVLFGSGEVDERQRHPLISRNLVPPLSFDAARAACSIDGRVTINRTTLEMAATAGQGLPTKVHP